MKQNKIILLISIMIMTACADPELPTPPSDAVESIFGVNENRITDGQEIHFDLPSDGIYTLTLIDKESEQVISRERFNGKRGKNIKQMYIKSIESKTLYLLLEDEFKTTLGKTIIII